MTAIETELTERLHAAADRIAVEPDLWLVLDRANHPRSGGSKRVHTTTAAPRTRVVVAVGVGTLAFGTLVVVDRLADGDDSTTGTAASPAPTSSSPGTPPAAGSAYLPHVAEPPDWFGQPQAASRQTGARTGRWVATVLGRTDTDDVTDPIVVAAFDGTWQPLEDATPITVDGLPALSIDAGGWGATAVVLSPTTGAVTQLVIGASHTLRAGLLPHVTIHRPSGELTLEVDQLPAGYEQLVTPRVLGPDPASRRTLASASGRTVLDDVSDMGDPLLAAAMAAVDLTAVDVHGRTGWLGRSTIRDVDTAFLVWSPQPGVVFQITTDDPERTADDLVELARATAAVPVDDWTSIYGD